MLMKAKAWLFHQIGGPEVLELGEHDLGPPGPGEALVRIRAVGLNRADLLYLAGRYFGPPPSPSYLGQEAVGEIVDLGPAVEGESAVGAHPLRVGMRVGLMAGRLDYTAMGTYRSAGIFGQRALLPLPDDYTFAEAAGLWVAAMTAVGGLRVGGLRPDGPTGKRVLVTAASSGVGVITLQAARAMGAETFASTTSPDKARQLEELADHVIVTRSAEELVEAVRQLTDDEGVDIAFDPVGFAYAQALMETAATDGQVVFYGLLAGTEAPFDMRNLILKDLGVHGYTVYRLQRDPELLEEIVATVMTLADGGGIRPLIAAEYRFEEAPEALAAMARNEHIGKIVLTVNRSTS
jgi:NADPH:quinone reductase-like Zn-dependent oxidoreductase